MGKSLVSLFPSLECATLPLPSIRPSIVHDIFNKQDQLNPKFNNKVDSLVQQILQKVTPKKAFNGVTTVNGKALAALAVGYVEAVNRPGALPDLDQGWQAVVRLELKEVSYRLVKEYENEMEEALKKEKLLVKQEWLMGIHCQILSGKKSVLKEKICRINPLHSSDKEVDLLLDQLEQDIVQWSKQCENEETRQVVGGSLLQFTTLNFSKSKEHCQTLFMQLMAESNIQQKVTEALRNSQPLDITAEVDTIVAEYEEKSLGPASSEILDKGLSEIEQLTSTLKKIPGRPGHEMFGSLDNRQIESNSVGCLQSTTQMLSKSMWCTRKIKTENGKKWPGQRTPRL